MLGSTGWKIVFVNIRNKEIYCSECDWFELWRTSVEDYIGQFLPILWPPPTNWLLTAQSLGGKEILWLSRSNGKWNTKHIVPKVQGIKLSKSWSSTIVIRHRTTHPCWRRDHLQLSSWSDQYHKICGSNDPSCLKCAFQGRARRFIASFSYTPAWWV